jgi:Holliday junction resolvasome RuvABC endonuclease subunit
MSETILGWDLSFACTGWCLIEHSKVLAYGSFHLEGSSTGAKLTDLYCKSSRLLTLYEPEVVAVEEIFFSKWTAMSFKPLCKLQSIIEMACWRHNRSLPIMARASEVRATFDIDSKDMKKKFVEFSKQKKYTRLSKGKQDKLYADYKKAQIVKKVNGIYPNLLTDDQHDIADAILLSLHVEKNVF